MSFIRWATPLGDKGKPLSKAYAWHDTRGGVVISVVGRKPGTECGDYAVRLSLKEMRYMCESFLAQHPKAPK